MKSLPTLAAAAALFLAFSAPVSADATRSLGKVGLWDILADNTLCHASLEYADDGVLFFGVSSDGRATVGVGNPKWNIPEGAYTVHSWVDRGAPAEFKADASKGVVVWSWTLDAEQVGILSRGAVFHATIGRAEIHYRLDGSAAMLQALTRCAAERMAAANPFAGAPPAATSKTPASTETPSNPFRKL